MCGIVGFINLTGNGSCIAAERAFKEMLLVGQIRGGDATGVAQMNRAGQTDWVKAACLPHEFMEMNRAREFFQKVSSFAWVGHNRAGTVGGNTNANAHPFETDTYLGVHNGTLRNKHELADKGYKYDVDSEAMFNGFEQNGVKETLKNTNGAYSIVYFDKKKRNINFVRNAERPMYFVEAQEMRYNNNTETVVTNLIFYGSEIGMIHWILARNGFKIGESKMSTPLKHYSFEMGEAKPHIFDVEKYEPKVYTNSFQDSDWGHGKGKRGRGVWHRQEPAAATVIGPVKSPVATLPSPRLAPALLSSVGGTQDDDIPFEIASLPYFKDVTAPLQKKKTLGRVFRESKHGASINFVIDDIAQLKEGYQLNCKLAGEKKAGLPVLITTAVDRQFVDEEVMAKERVEAIWTAKVISKGLSTDGKVLVIYVRDPEPLMVDMNAKETNVTC